MTKQCSIAVEKVHVTPAWGRILGRVEHVMIRIYCHAHEPRLKDFSLDFLHCNEKRKSQTRARRKVQIQLSFIHLQTKLSVGTFDTATKRKTSSKLRCIL
jgi:DNA replication protein DnaC